jgi:hypothetical protein
MSTAPLASALLLSTLLASPAFAQRDLSAEATRKPGDAVAGQPDCSWQHRGGWVVDCGPVVQTPPIPPPDLGDAMDVAAKRTYLPGWRYTQQDLNGGVRLVVLSVTTGLDGRLVVLGQVYYSGTAAVAEGSVLAFTPGEPGDPNVFVNGPWPVGAALANGWRLDQVERGR